MALARTKIWIAGEVLTAADLNSEFNSILNNPVSLISPLTGALDFDGFTLTLDAAAATTVVSSAAVSWNFTSGAKTGTPATTGSVFNFSAQTFTDNNTAASGTAAAYTAYALQRPTLAATNATVTTTDAATLYIPNAPAAGTNETLTNAYALWVDDGRVRLDPSATVVSGASATLDAINITAQTATITGSTNITTAAGVNFVTVGRPTLSAASALTVTNAATLYIANSPAAAGAGPATITNAYALWIDDGNVRFDDDIYWRSGTAFNGIFAHNITAARTWTFPDVTGTVFLESGGTLTGALTLANEAFGALQAVPARDIAGYLFGLTLSNNSVDATNDIDIAAGVAIDSTNAYVLRLASALTKRLDAAWAVGTNAGGLDTGVIANNTYHVWLIARSDTGVVDALFSLSATSPTMPTSYDFRRRIGSILRESAAIVAFVQDGDYFRRNASVLDVDATSPGTSAVTRTLSVPTGINVFALGNAMIEPSATARAGWYLSDLAANDEAPSSSAAPLFTVEDAASNRNTVPTMVRTNTSAQIRSRASTANADRVALATLGWIDRRGRDA